MTDPDDDYPGRVQDAYRLCRKLYADTCRCEVRAGTPCEVIIDMIDMDQDIGVELRRMERGRRQE